jgi:hypothetical protein
MHYEAARPGVAWIGVWVREAARGRGIGGGLYARAEQHVRANGARRLLTTTHDDETSRRFAASRGFRHTHTERITAVDPRTVDLAAFAALAAEKADEGFKVVPMAEVRPEEVFAVDMEATHDIPMDEPPTKSRFDQWEAKHWRHPDLSLDASQVVVDRERRVVSFAMVSVDQARRRAANEMTGTLRRFRGRRLARLAKLGTIALAVDNGITQILTGNDETNVPMLAINASLGYRPVASELSWVRDL